MRWRQRYAERSRPPKARRLAASERDGPAGVVIGATVYTVEAAEIEQRFERGEITRGCEGQSSRSHGPSL